MPQLSLPRSGTVTLILFVMTFGVMAMVFSWHGFAYMLGTILFGVGVQPHVKQLATEGHRISFAWSWRKKRFERTFRLQVRSEAMARALFSWSAGLLVVAIVPVMAYVLQKQGVTFASRLQDQEVLIREQANSLLIWAQSFAPTIIPEGDIGSVFGGVVSQLFGDLKNVTLAVAEQGLKLTSVILKDWVLLGISALLIATLLGNWDTEVTRFRSIVSGGISNDRLRQSTLRFLELYQDGLSVLMIGFLEVFATLTVLYIAAMVIFPFNLSFGAILLIALTLGAITAVWKIGGAIAMVVGALLILLNFEAGLSWFGLGYFSFGFFPDILIKVTAILIISKVLGLLEAYNFTPSVIGKKLNLTKMQMVSTILIWALGSGFFGMIWGVLLMLLFQASMRLTAEQAEEPTLIFASRRTDASSKVT